MNFFPCIWPIRLISSCFRLNWKQIIFQHHCKNGSWKPEEPEGEKKLKRKANNKTNWPASETPRVKLQTHIWCKKKLTQMVATGSNMKKLLLLEIHTSCKMKSTPLIQIFIHYKSHLNSPHNVFDQYLVGQMTAQHPFVLVQSSLNMLLRHPRWYLHRYTQRQNIPEDSTINM